MPTPTPKPAPFTPAKAALLRKRIESLRKAAKAPSLRALVEIIYDLNGKPKRTEVDERMQGVIRVMTLADGATAADIAKVLDISVPAVNSQRRKLGLTRKRAAKPAGEEQGDDFTIMRIPPEDRAPAVAQIAENPA